MYPLNVHGLSITQIDLLPIPAPEPHTLRDNAKHKNAAGGNPPAAQRGDLVLQIVCPDLGEPHAAAGSVGVFAQRLQALIAVLRSHLAGLRIVNELNHGRHCSFILYAKLSDGIRIAKDR